jgi:hypothetical protein
MSRSSVTDDANAPPTLKRVAIFTDGAAVANPGAGAGVQDKSSVKQS